MFAQNEVRSSLEAIRFDFDGPIGSSKSIVNRLLICSSFNSELRVLHRSFARDVVLLESALARLSTADSSPGPLELDCGAGGTTLRFLALRVSRLSGSWILRGDRRLFARGQTELIDILSQLGVETDLRADRLIINSDGWQHVSTVRVSVARSSQFLSALILSSWDLTHDLRVKLSGPITSQAYFKATLNLVEQLGMSFRQEDNSLIIAAQSSCKSGLFRAPSDASSSFALAALAAQGRFRIEVSPDLQGAPQPDWYGLSVLGRMGWRFKNDAFLHSNATATSPAFIEGFGPGIQDLKCVELCLSDTPDLFPVLAVLCAFASGQSVLSGAPQLRYKESDRIEWVQRFIEQLGRRTEVRDDGMVVFGRPPSKNELLKPIIISCDQDHRAVMAAAVAKQLGYQVTVHDAHFVSKSFPEFWWCLRRAGWTETQLNEFFPERKVLPDYFDRSCLIGQRGVGKSSFLCRHATQFLAAGILPIDLDSEIEWHEGKAIHDLFSERGEAEFREHEKNLSSHLKSLAPCHMVLGGGFDINLVGSDFFKIWLRRESDRTGRIFLDRPRLDKKLRALDEFQQRSQEREKRYLSACDLQLWLAEGAKDVISLASPFDLRGASLTLEVPSPVLRLNREYQQAWLQQWWNLRKNWGLRWVELRDDLCDTDFMQMAIGIIGREHTLLAHRSAVFRSETAALARMNSAALDWPIEFEVPMQCSPLVRSYHGDSVNHKGLVYAGKEILKLAIHCRSFSDILFHHKWALQDPERRSFLPISADGRWQWYRILFGPGFPLQFVREGNSRVPDQPILYQWSERLKLPIKVLGFAAVLGDPIRLSQTPSFQRSYFARVKYPIVGISISHDEWQEALPILCELGLKAAAITAPLKKLAFQSCQQVTPVARNLESVNTIAIRDYNIFGHNTDLAGFLATWKKIANRTGLDSEEVSIVIWGGGGTRQMLRSVLPKAQRFSVRSLEQNDLARADGLTPEVLVWAARADAQAPQFIRWKPSVVVDLNYFEHSQAREYSLLRGARYFSGVDMFEIQALNQQLWWDRALAQRSPEEV